jgi:SAM-dependent methyltransferase
VVASHALSHADDPDALVEAIGRILAPDGVLAIELHHVLGLIEGQFDVLSHAHRSYFSLRALEHLLARHDLVIAEVERVATFGGTIRALARRRSVGHAAGGPAQEAIRRAEDRARAGEPAGYAALPAQVARASADLVAYLEGARDDGRLVAGYGAPARGTVLLNLAGVDPALLPFTVDRDPAKQGMALPGCRIVVHAPSEIDSRRPDDILVLPWPLADEIQRQLRAARGWGARFAVAMPTLRIL